MNDGLTIAEVAERTGLTPHTLRYYERDGLLVQSVNRSAAGHRTYTEADLRWIVMLTCLRATGMPIREIRTYVELVRGGEGNEGARLDLLHTHRQRVLAQLAQVTDHLSAIDGKIALYENRRAGADSPTLTSTSGAA